VIAQAPVTMAITPDGRTAYIVDTAGGSLIPVDLATDVPARRGRVFWAGRRGQAGQPPRCSAAGSIYIYLSGSVIVNRFS
jgi:sugar lactone lactonase YvrE